MKSKNMKKKRSRKQLRQSSRAAARGAFAKVAERLLELQLLFCAQKRKAGSEEPAIHGIIH